MNLSKVVALATAVVVALSFAVEAEAKKRLGGGGSMGMQRSAPAKNSPNSPPAQQATPAQNTPATAPQASPQPAAAAAPMAAAAPAAAAAQKRSWLGPIAGLAAGLGIAALLSHFGMGEAVANFLMMALLVVAGALLIGFLIRRFRGGQSSPALATANAGAASAPSGMGAPSWQRENSVAPAGATTTAFTSAPSGEVSVTGQPLAPLNVPGSGDSASPSMATAPVESSATSASAGSWGAPVLPEGFDAAAFERVAKMIFIRLQAANDAGNLEDLRQFTTPEMFAAIRLEIQERTGSVQVTDVQRVDAQILDFATQEGQQVVSVRFHGMIREDQEAAEAFDEVWHLCRPVDESRAWAIAGIQQAQ